ncbi:MAG: methyltransferase domain-containing protein [Hyphomicrobiales bacterium]|nr:methyltransferase domain-containing protein [Hyphomicrobiales bacterium]
MAETPLIFDRSLVLRRQLRALAQGPADFLLRAAVEELAARLSAVQRDFAEALDVGSPSPLLSEAIARPGRRIARIVADPAFGPRAAVGDEERLDVAPQSVDLVVSALALQWVNDLPGALVQMRRALRPDGLLLACMIGGGSLAELRAAFTEAEAELEGGASPRVAPFADVRAAGNLLQRAGFALPVADSEAIVVRYDSMFGLTSDLRAMGATNPLFSRAKKPLRRATLMRAAELYAEKFSDPDGRIRATFEFLWLSGWAPHESQQKPAPRGSGQVSLADALKPRRPRDA